MTEVDLNEKISSILISANEKFLSKDYENVIRNLKEAEMLDRQNSEVLYNLGIAHAKLGLLKTSIDYFEKLINLPSTTVEIFNVKKVLAFLFVKSEDYTKADAINNEVLKFLPSDTVALNIKGFIFEKTGNFSEAVKIYKKIIAIDKSDYNAYNSLGYILSNKYSDYNESLKYARLAYESNKYNPAYLDTMGFIFMKKGDIKSGEKFLKKAYSLLPHSSEINEHIKMLNVQKKER